MGEKRGRRNSCLNICTEELYSWWQISFRFFLKINFLRRNIFNLLVFPGKKIIKEILEFSIQVNSLNANTEVTH